MSRKAEVRNSDVIKKADNECVTKGGKLDKYEVGKQYYEKRNRNIRFYNGI